MARARLYEVIQRSSGAILPGAQVTLRYTGTTTAITESVYNQAAGGSPQSMPLTADSHGVVEAWLDLPTEVDLWITYPGLVSYTYPRVRVLPYVGDWINRTAAGTIAGATLSTPTINTPSISGGTISNPTISNPVFSGTVRFPDGSAGAPGVAFSSESTLGLWRASPGVMQMPSGRMALGQGGWPYDFAAPSTYAPVKTPSHLSITDGTDATLSGGNTGTQTVAAAPSTSTSSMVSLSRVTSADTPGSSYDQNGMVNITFKRVPGTSLNETNTIISHDGVVISTYQDAGCNMAPLTLRVVQDYLRGPATYAGSDAATKANAQKNLSAFALFANIQRYYKEAETIGVEMNPDSQVAVDAGRDYNNDVGQAGWYNASAVLQASQVGRSVAFSAVGKGISGHTAAYVVASDPTGGGTANSAKFATGLDILPSSIWSGRAAIRVQAQNPSLQTAYGQPLTWEMQASTIGTPVVNSVLYLGAIAGNNNNVIVNAPSGKFISFQANSTDLARVVDALGFAAMPGYKYHGVTSSGTVYTPLLYSSTINDNTIHNAPSGKAHQWYLADTTLIGTLNGTGIGIGVTPTYPFHGESTLTLDRIGQFVNHRTSGNNFGAVGSSDGTGATQNVGVYGYAFGATTNYGIYSDTHAFVNGHLKLQSPTVGLYNYYVATVADDAPVSANALPNNFTGLVIITFKDNSSANHKVGIYRQNGYIADMTAISADTIFNQQDGGGGGTDPDHSFNLDFTGGTLRYRNRTDGQIRDLSIIGIGIA